MNIALNNSNCTFHFFLSFFRSVSNFLRRSIYLNRSASHLLFRRIQKIKKSILPQSMSNNDSKVSLLRCVPCVAIKSRILYPTRIKSTIMGLLFNVSLLSVADDMCIIDRLSMGRGKNSNASNLKGVIIKFYNLLRHFISAISPGSGSFYQKAS